MKKYLMSMMMSVFVFICLGFIVLSLPSAFNACYAIGDKIDASKLKDYYLEYSETETNNRFINGYGVIQDRIGYSRSTKFGLIDENYNVVLEPDTYFQIEFDPMDKDIIYCYIDPYSKYGDFYRITDNGPVKINKEMHFLNHKYIYAYSSDTTTGEVSFFCTSDMISVSNLNPEYGVIDENGNEDRSSEYGVIDRNGDIIIEFTKDYFYIVRGHLIARYEILDFNDIGVPILTNAEILDDKGNVLSHSKYDKVTIFLDYADSKPEVVAIEVMKEGKLNLLSLDDYEEVFDWSYKHFMSHKNYIIAKNSAGKWGLLNKDFQVIINFDYEDIDLTTGTLYGYKNGIKELIQLPEDKPKAPANTNLTAELPTFDITLNGVKIDNSNRLYPFIVYNGITYFPMTYYDSRFLNLKTEWDASTGLKVLKGDESSGYITDAAKIKHPELMKPALAAFDIHINGKKIDNQSELYPLLLYKNITYFPMTWKFGVEEFGWDYKYTYEKGLVINSH